MGTVRNIVEARCTPEEAFDYLSDSRNELEWSPECERMEKLTDGPVGVGTRFAAKWRLSPPAEIEILTYERPTAWTAVSRGGIDVHFSATVEAMDGGTRVVAELTPAARGLYRLFVPLFALMMRRSGPASVEQMREALERRHEGQPSG